MSYETQLLGEWKGRPLPSVYEGTVAANGLGLIEARYVDGLRETLWATDDYVVDGFTWGTGISESARSTAAALLAHQGRLGMPIPPAGDVVHRAIAQDIVDMWPRNASWLMSALELHARIWRAVLRS